MPSQLGTKILSVTYNKATLTIALTGEAFAENEYPGISAIDVSVVGSGIWMAAAVSVWSDTAAQGIFANKLIPGKSYYIRITSSDGEQDTITQKLAKAINIIRFRLGFGF